MTFVRPTLSKKNKFYINKYRQYELKYFCLQYFYYKKCANSYDGYSKGSAERVYTSNISKPTEKCYESREYYVSRIRVIEKAAKMCDPVLSDYILIGVTGNLSYEKIRARTNIPCSKAVYYDLYHKFFFVLDRLCR